MMQKVKLFLTVSAILFLAGGSYAQPSCFDSAEKDSVSSLLNNYMELMRQAKWIEMAGLMDQNDLGQIKNLMVVLADKIDSAGNANEPNPIFGDSVQTGADVKKLSNAAVFSMLMNFISSSSPGMLDMFRSGQFKYIGSVCETDAKAYAVSKVTFTIVDAPVEMTDVIPLIKGADGKWKIGLKGDMKLFIQSLGNM
jgi:hypothetical protein